MTKFISKEAKRLAKLKFNEKKPSRINHTPQTKTRTDYWISLDRVQLQMILDSPDFDHMAPCEYFIEIHYSRTETEQECLDRISKQQTEWDAYELRKKCFYADIKKKIHEAEEAEKIRRNRFADPDYIEFLRLKKRFEGQ